jgi:hypothetical protein
MSKVQYKLKCIHCNERTNEKYTIDNVNNYLGYNSYYFLYECNDCIICSKLFSEYRNSKDKKKFIENISKDYLNEYLRIIKCGNDDHVTCEYNAHIHDITQTINLINYKYELYRCDMFKFTNCCNCKIAIRTDHTYITNHALINPIYDINKLYFCIYCSLIKKEILRSKNKALKEYFLKFDDIKNLKTDCGKFYIGDLLKKRNEKYDNLTIEQLIIKSKKHDILKQEKKKNKKLLIESRKNDIIKEIKNIGLYNEDINFNNKHIKKYLHTDDNLNSVIEMLIEDRFLETKTNYLVYLFTYGYIEGIFHIDILGYIYLKLYYITHNKKNKKSKKGNDISDLKDKNELKNNDISDLKDKNFWPFYYSYILKRLSKIEQSRIMKKIYNNCIRTKEDLEDFEVLKIKVECYAIKEFNNIDNKYEVPPRFANLSDETIDKNCTEPIYKLSDDIYNKYYEYLIKSAPDFETNVTKMLNKYKDSSSELKLDNKNDIIEPIEMKLVKKNNKNDIKNDDIIIID